MADDKLIKILQRSIDEWNDWRLGHQEVEHPDFSGANLSGMELIGADFSGGDFSRANLSKATLLLARLNGADLSGARLSGARLLSASLSRADLSDADLSGADLSSASLLQTNLSGANLSGTTFARSMVFKSVFSDLNLRGAIGLEEVMHLGPSTIGIDTIIKSEGKIPIVFLRGCGVPESIIEQLPGLIAAMQPIQFHSCFISYSGEDEELAQRLYKDLQSKGVRCWFAPENLKIGERFRPRIDEAIQHHDRLLLILSEHSVTSSWVEKEVETALESEDEQKRTVLFPVRLDDAVMKIKTGWPADVRRARQIGDFRRWKDPDEYQKAFNRLIADLKSEA